MAELGRHGYRVGPGTLYPILHSLEQQRYLRRDEQVVDGKVRKYYRITPAGRRILARAQAQLHEVVAEVLPEAGPTASKTRRGIQRKPCRLGRPIALHQEEKVRRRRGKS